MTHLTNIRERHSWKGPVNYVSEKHRHCESDCSEAVMRAEGSPPKILLLGKHSSHCTGGSTCLSTHKTEYKGMSPSPFAPQCLLYVCHHTPTMHSTSGIQGSWTLKCTLLQLPLPPKELKKKMPGIKEEGAFTPHASLATLNTHSSHLGDSSRLLWRAFFTEPHWILSLATLPFSALGDLMCIKRNCCLFSLSSTLPP